MGQVLSTLDYVIFFASLVGVMAIGLWAGRREETSDDYYLAGRRTKWWGVAGSIFGSNVSANHIVGMMGVGFSVGFAQSHFEITAIAGLLLLCFGFLPMYRKLNVTTLSEYLSQRYNDGSRVLYALIMIVVIVVIQMVPGFYIGSRSINILLQGGPGEIDQTYYVVGIIVMAAVTGIYTIIGGLRAVIFTDVIQSVLLLAAGLVVAFITFAQPEVGGWSGMVAMDSAADGAHRLHLYNPPNDPNLPWTGVLTGLMVLHFYYWGANQFIVQRALSAGTDREARYGIIAAGFFKLLIPFFSIGTGIAAYYMFQKRDMVVDQDAVFTTLLTELVSPIGFGLVGLVAAGMIGAILSSIDSMMNSAATIVTFDIYQRYINPEESEKGLIWMGRVCILIFLCGAAGLTIFTMDPNSQDSFFLNIASHQSKLVAGVVVAFLLGMFWKRATSAGAIAAIVAGVMFSYLLPPVYDHYIDARKIDEINRVVMTTSEPHGFGEAQPVMWRAYQTVPTTTPQITTDATYYVFSDGPQDITLHTTREDALFGRDPIEFEDHGQGDFYLYRPEHAGFVRWFNVELNFMISVFAAAIFALIIHVAVSLATQADPAGAKLTWVGAGVLQATTLKRFVIVFVFSLGIYAVLALLMVAGQLPPYLAAFIGGGWTWFAFIAGILLGHRSEQADAEPQPPLLANDRFWAGLLAGLAVFMMYYFY